MDAAKAISHPIYNTHYSRFRRKGGEVTSAIEIVVRKKGSPKTYPAVQVLPLCREGIALPLFIAREL
jgi:hypothetical protein